jgi:hypothetical protein
VEASNKTEFQPRSRQSVITSRSGQWSRCRATGTSMPAVIAVHMAKSTSEPMALTVFTEVCTITGERASTAPARTASMVRSFTMLIAGTPYFSANARSTISLRVLTAMCASLPRVLLGMVGGYPPTGNGGTRPGSCA